MEWVLCMEWDLNKRGVRVLCTMEFRPEDLHVCV